MDMEKSFELFNWPTNKEYKNVGESYLSLRRWIGVLGILLPIINILGGWFISKTPVLDSISNYYHTNMRDFFVGILCVVSLFLISYEGYNKVDENITSATGIFGLGVAIIPCSTKLVSATKVGLFQLDMDLSGTLHLISAGMFLVLLAINSMFLFTMTGQEKQKTKQKQIRNIIYKTCGLIILLSIFGAVVCFNIMTQEVLEKSRVILILETFALVAFGVSWLIKGETLLKDKVQQPPSKPGSGVSYTI